MSKRARSITPPDVGMFAPTAGRDGKPENTSAHPAKRTHTDVKFLPNKIATFENAAKADQYTPFARLTDAMAATVKAVKGNAVVYWMRMEDMRGMLNNLRSTSTLCSRLNST